MLGGERGGERLDLGLGLPEGDSRFQTGDNVDNARCALVAGQDGKLDVHGRPKLFAPRKDEPCRHDADDGAGATVEPDRLPDDVGPAAEIGLPQGVGEDDGGGDAGPVVLGCKVAAEGGRHAERTEEVVADVAGVAALSDAADREIGAGHIQIAGEGFEAGLPGAQVGEVGTGDDRGRVGA